MIEKVAIEGRVRLTESEEKSSAEGIKSIISSSKLNAPISLDDYAKSVAMLLCVRLQNVRASLSQ